jgi:glyoxylase-like metal-dependent hydrolase (beta-lactamase superfamily II)
VIIESVVAPYFETNCWIIAPSANSECIIVDPGISEPNLIAPIKKTLQEKNLKPVAVLLTHGHLDHTFSVVPLANGYGIPALIHTRDRGALTDPYQVIMRGGPTEQIIKAFGNLKFEEPEFLTSLNGEENLDFAGFKLKVTHAPGHTAGSAMFTLDESHLISGDVLFAGAIGRTDMPSGSMSDMKKTLINKVLPLPDELIVLPGHGAQTTIARERNKNPYLQTDFLSQV